MYIVNITLNVDEVPKDQAENMFNQHRQWFAKNHQEGRFLLLGPYTDREHAGIIVAQTENREALEKILESDVYYPLGLADYEIREFKAVMVADNVKKFEGK